VSAYFEAALSCPACFRDLGVALVEDGSGRDPSAWRPRDGDQTVCSHCTTFLRYVEKVDLEGSALGLNVIDRDAFERLPERDQAELMNVRNKLITMRTQGREQQGAVNAALARELATLKKRVDTAACGCIYCSSGDGLNCARRRRWA
jgi:hypothetical protein